MLVENELWLLSGINVIDINAVRYGKGNLLSLASMKLWKEMANGGFWMKEILKCRTWYSVQTWLTTVNLGMTV